MRRLLLLVILTCVASTAPAAEPLVVHEWGTFTSLQNEQGETIAGINSDDEPVPMFCHSLHWGLIQSTPPLSQGVPRCHPDVTMRLETPVVYFHLPAGAAPVTLDVSATFNGGWLTQFYPDAKVTGAAAASSPTPGPIDAQTAGTLTWKNVQVGPAGQLPQTDAHVWTTPRNVDAVTVTVADAKGRPESEKYLFYRGVGHIDAPLTARQHDGKIELRGDASIMSTPAGGELIANVWVANFGPDGSCHAVRVGLWGGPGISTVNNPVDGTDRAMDLKSLRADMKGALVHAGLFEDEAEAMLATWELSYFKSPGLRVFYLVPRAWVDQRLPLTLSIDAKVTRVMIGRLELVTPRQRELLNQITDALPVRMKTTARGDTVGDAVSKAWDDLGRFRNALVLDDLRRRPAATLRQFVRLNDLEAFAVPRAASPARNAPAGQN